MSDPERRRVIRYLKRPAFLTRDDVGGAVGVRWIPADRGGKKEFGAKACEKLLAHGCVISGQKHHLVKAPGSQATYRLAPVD